MRPDRFSKEMVETAELFFKFFGKGVDAYAFLILTYTETEEDMMNYIHGGETNPDDEGEKAFKVLRKRCQDKILFIDNKASKDDKEQMVLNILTAIDTANGKSSRPYFQNRLTREIDKRATDFYLTHVRGLGSTRSTEGNHIIFVLLTFAF
ncbi:hypothetical protein DPMN_017745 [Dreissena polymorpha]|uniref:AIG1-type G domain-containing protein n=1 Tax=Dreissena polymorpha TaxID=45954 RepID=A0A9D4S8H0_DREPO|nr:hypothetical protein DPMN_017745 [Dreissena polymorpha]